MTDSKEREVRRMSEEEQRINFDELIVRKPVIPERALRFRDEDGFKKALDIVEALDLEAIKDGRRFFYDHISESINGLPGLMMPEPLFEKLIFLLEEQQIDFFEIRAIPVSGLPVELQRIIRGRN